MPGEQRDNMHLLVIRAELRRKEAPGVRELSCRHWLQTWPPALGRPQNVTAAAFLPKGFVLQFIP